MQIPKWEGRRAQQARARVKQVGANRNLPCCICNQPIDYKLPSTDPDGCSVQHLKPRKTFPQLTWDPNNWAPAHLACNKSAGAKINAPLGVTSRTW